MLWQDKQNQMKQNVTQPAGIVQPVSQSTAQPETPSAQNSGNVAIRNTLTGQYGLDNSKIGYDNGWVTYNGQNLLQPDWVDESAGVSYVSDPNKIYSAVAGLDANGRTAVRGALSGSYGLDNDKIGYDNGWVTYNGQQLIRPDAEENGVSYVSNRDNLTGAVLNYYKNNGVNVVQATDYAANSGYPFQVDHQNGTISMNGQTIKPKFVENGVAYVDSAAIDGAIAAARERSGIQNKKDIWQKHEDRVNPVYDKLTDLLVNREAFDYNPENDVVFQAYKNQYNREGDRAMRDAIGSMSGLTGGYANSAAVTAGAQQRQYWGDKLMDRIPELAEQAYNRYVGDFDMNRQALDSIMALDNQRYGREYGVNDDLINDVRYNNQLKTEREDKWYDRNHTERREAAADDQWNKEYERTLKNDEVNRASTEAATEATRQANLTQRRLDTLQMAQYNGAWPPEASELGFDTTKDPYYYNIRLLEIERDDTIAKQKALKELQNSYASGGGSGGSGGRSSGTRSSSAKKSKGSNAAKASVPDSGADLMGNSHGDSWVYVQGFGRVTYQELQNAVDDGEITEEYRDGKYYYRKAK